MLLFSSKKYKEKYHFRAMLQGIKDYVRCAWQNKVTKFGYLALLGIRGIEITKKYLEIQGSENLFMVEFAIGFLGAGALLISEFGAKTFIEYRRGRKIFQNRAEISLGTVWAHYNAPYCTQVGMEMAAKDSGLGLIPQDENTVRRAYDESLDKVVDALTE